MQEAVEGLAVAEKAAEEKVVEEMEVVMEVEMVAKMEEALVVADLAYSNLSSRTLS